MVSPCQGGVRQATETDCLLKNRVHPNDNSRSRASCIDAFSMPVFSEVSPPHDASATRVKKRARGALPARARRPVDVRVVSIPMPEQPAHPRGFEIDWSVEWGANRMPCMPHLGWQLQGSRSPIEVQGEQGVVAGDLAIRVPDSGEAPMSNAAASPLSSSVLVLNRLYMAVHVVSVRRAFGLLFRELAEVIHVEDRDSTPTTISIVRAKSASCGRPSSAARRLDPLREFRDPGPAQSSGC